MNIKINDFMIFEKFVDQKILDKLNDWCLENYNKNFFYDANMGAPGTRMTTRYEDDWDSFSFPDEAYEIQNKIIDYFEIKNFYYPKFKDGIVCGIGFEGGDIFEHKDPIYYEDTTTVHFNVLSKKPYSGGNTYINKKVASVNEGDLLCMKVSEEEHFVDIISGDRERILWVFGFCIPNDQII